jgi:hypothetical protein
MTQLSLIIAELPCAVGYRILFPLVMHTVYAQCLRTVFHLVIGFVPTIEFLCPE